MLGSVLTLENFGQGATAAVVRACLPPGMYRHVAAAAHECLPAVPTTAPALCVDGVTS